MLLFVICPKPWKLSSISQFKVGGFPLSRICERMQFYHQVMASEGARDEAWVQATQLVHKLQPPLFEKMKP